MAALNSPLWLGVAVAAVLAIQVVAADVQDGIAERGAYPYQAAVVPYSNPEDLHVCGGSLVAAKWVLSSAACINYCSNVTAHARRATGLGSAGSPWRSPAVRDVGRCNEFLRVILGALYLTHEEPEQQWYTVNKVVTHPDAKSDVTLLRLNEAVTFTEYIRPVALVGKSEDDLTNLMLTGWGSVENNNLKALSLLATKAFRYSSFVCSTAFILQDLQPYNFCGFQNTCAADVGGSPVVLRDGNSLVQVAFSSGVFCKQCDRIHPTLFVRLAPFVDWIRTVVATNQ